MLLVYCSWWWWCALGRRGFVSVRSCVKMNCELHRVFVLLFWPQYVISRWIRFTFLRKTCADRERVNARLIYLYLSVSVSPLVSVVYFLSLSTVSVCCKNKRIHSYHSTDFYGTYAIIYLFIQLGFLFCLLLVNILLHSRLWYPCAFVFLFSFYGCCCWCLFLLGSPFFRVPLILNHLWCQCVFPYGALNSERYPALFCLLISFILCVSF